MPPKKIAQLRPAALPPEKRSSSRRQTRNTLNLTSKTFDNIINNESDEDEEEEEPEDTRTPLEKVPPELMDMILEFALTSDQPIKISKLGRHQMPGILQVNRKNRNTGLKIYYSKNDFRAIVTGEHPDGPLNWVTDIASDNLRYIPSFTFDYRLAVLDYQRWYKRLSRTDEKNREHQDGLLEMCDDARGGIVSTAFRFSRQLLDLSVLRLHVDLVPSDIPLALKVDRKGLRTFLAKRIARLCLAMEGLIGPEINPVTTPRNNISSSIRRGTAMRSAFECWDLVVT
jgi:hypothetical protein